MCLLIKPNSKHNQGQLHHNSKEASSAFKQQKEILSKYYYGKYVLICETRMVDVYDTFRDAKKDGLIRFGEDSFSIEKIT